MNKKRTIILITFIALAVALLGVGSYFFYFQGLTPFHILNGVTIGNVDVGGMTMDEATAAVNKNLVEAYQKNDVTVTIEDEQITVPSDVYSAKLDVKAAVKSAMLYGRTGSYAQRKTQKLASATEKHQVDLTNALTIDQAATTEVLGEFHQLFKSELNQHNWVVKGDAPDLEAPIESIVPQTLSITKGTTMKVVDMDGLLSEFYGVLSLGQFQVTYSCTDTAPDPMDWDSLYKELSKNAKDAVMDPETFQITRESNKYDFDKAQAAADFEKLPEGDVLEVTFRLTPPSVTYQALYDELFKDQLATFTAHCASGYNRATNLRVACETLNGMIIYPGEEFSYSPALGERTAEAGYLPAGTYVGNESVATYGGGICQVSSCLYYCAVVADLEILERHNHTFNTGYMPIGTDATVFWGGPNFRFRNNTKYPIRIDAVADGGTTTLSLSGTDDKDYYVKFESYATGVTNYEVVEEFLPEDNPKGYKDGDEITSPYTGYSAVSYRAKYDKETDELISRDWEADSYYSHRDKVICRIITPEPEPAPEPAPTEPVPAPVPDEPAAVPDEPAA